MKIGKIKLIPMTCDMVFKKMWGDPDNVDRLSALLSIILDIPYQELKGNVEIIESEKRITNNLEKNQKLDVLAKIMLNVLGKVNLEMNIGFDKTDVERNTSYLAHIFSCNIRKGEDYSEIETVIQINFNDYDVDKENNDIVEKYYFMNDKRNILTKKLQIYHINIEKCKRIWYSGCVEDYSKKERQVIRLCTLMNLTDNNEFETCLREIDMEENVKKNIENVEKTLSTDDELLAYYGSEEDFRRLQQGKLKNAEKEATERGFEKGLKDGLEQGIEQGIKEGIEQGIEQEKIEIAKNLLSQNVDIEIIKKATGMTEKNIRELEI